MCDENGYKWATPTNHIKVQNDALKLSIALVVDFHSSENPYLNVDAT